MIAKEKARLEHLVFESGGYMSQASTKQFVAVLDFGAQYGQLIARRVRDLNVYSEIVPCDISADELREMAPSALILSGGPASVYAEDAPRVDPAIFELGVPVLGFCYGHQITAVTLGGKVAHSEIGEYGPATIERDHDSALFNSTPLKQTVWMSHRDSVCEVPEGFTVTASTDVCPVAAMENAERKIYATQFHPEVKHTEHGQQILSNFLFSICGLEKNWSMDNLVETMTNEFREKVGNDRVILALSGGVDSSVVAALGLPEHIVYRQPFPGPGLAIRITGEVTPDKVKMVQEADAIWREEIAKAGLDKSISQYYAALTNMRSVGVMGDERTYDYAVALRAVTTTDFMTAEAAEIPWSLLQTVTSRIVNEVQHVNRVLYDCTGKPPATIEFE